MTEVETSGGANVRGNANTDGGDFVNRDQRTENRIEINLANPAQHDAPVRRQLPLEIEREFRQMFERLTTAITELRATVTINNTLTEAQIRVAREQAESARAIAEQAKDMAEKGLSGLHIVSVNNRVPKWLWPGLTLFGLMVVILLGVIAWQLTMGGA